MKASFLPQPLARTAFSPNFFSLRESEGDRGFPCLVRGDGIFRILLVENLIFRVSRRPYPSAPTVPALVLPCGQRRITFLLVGEGFLSIVIFVHPPLCGLFHNHFSVLQPPHDGLLVVGGVTKRFPSYSTLPPSELSSFWQGFFPVPLCDHLLPALLQLSIILAFFAQVFLHGALQLVFGGPFPLGSTPNPFDTKPPPLGNFVIFFQVFLPSSCTSFFFFLRDAFHTVPLSFPKPDNSRRRIGFRPRSG